MKKETKRRKNQPTIFQRWRHSVWLFPSILALLFCILTVARLSGTSVGAYHQQLFGTSEKDPNLIAGSPRTIRSDEWLVMTQLIVAQSKANFPKENENIGNGLDMSVLIDVPYREWSIVFKPQNLVFLVLPLEYAFAFKWWLLVFLLIVSCYLFLLRIFPDKRLLASVLATAFSLSPFIFWWYQSITILPLAYAFLLMILAIRIINAQPIRWIANKKMLWSYVGYGLAVSYLLVCFALLMYPPFLIPIAIVTAAFIVGYALQQRVSLKRLGTSSLFKRLSVMAVAGVLAGSIVGLFLFTRANAITAAQNTVYPGARVVPSGGYEAYKLGASFLQPQLQRTERAVNYYDNQSEASNFILLAPFLLIPSLALLVTNYRKNKKIDWLLLALTASVCLFLVRLLLPGLDVFYKLTFLDKVPHPRLLIGLGLASFLQFILFLKKIGYYKDSTLTRAMNFGYYVVCLFALLWVGHIVHDAYPGFIANWLVIAALALAFSLVILFALFGRKMAAATCLLAFTLISVYNIHPLYRGLGILTSGAINEIVRSASQPEDTWIATDNITFENIGIVNNRDSISGVFFYPDMSLWQESNIPSSDQIFNRYAHIIFSTNTVLPEKARLQNADLVQIRFSCDEFITSKVEFVVSPTRLNTACTQQFDEVIFPNARFYFYRVVK